MGSMEARPLMNSQIRFASGESLGCIVQSIPSLGSQTLRWWAAGGRLSVVAPGLLSHHWRGGEHFEAPQQVVHNVAPNWQLCRARKVSGSMIGGAVRPTLLLGPPTSRPQRGSAGPEKSKLPDKLSSWSPHRFGVV